MRIPSRHRSSFIIFVLLLALASYLYVIVIADALEALGGAISKGAAFELVFAAIALWVVLAILLLLGGRKGRMPRWAMRLALVAVPVSAFSAFVAMSMIWAPKRWPIVFPVCLPILLASYAVWMQAPQLDSVVPPRVASLCALSLIFMLSIVPLFMSAYRWASLG